MAKRMQELNTAIKPAIDFVLWEIAHICCDVKKRVAAWGRDIGNPA